MKKRNSFSLISLAAVLIFSMSMFAQEKTEVTVLVKKDGKVVKDTTYQFDDVDEAQHALNMMEILSGDGEHVIVLKSGDGETIEILTDVDEDGNIVKKKTVKVMVSGDDEHLDSKELKEVEEEVYVISGDDVKVIVIKTKQKKQ